MNSTCSKTSLLPTTEHAAPAHGETSTHKVPECLLMLLCIILAGVQFFVHFSLYGIESRFSARLDLLARGLCVSIPASLPTAAILFAVAPWMARPDRIAFARYTVLLCYLLGSSLSAWFLTREL